MLLGAVMGTGRFDFDRAHEHPLWEKELYGFASHVPEADAAAFTPRAWERLPDPFPRWGAAV